MKKTWKTWTSVLLVLMMGVILTACGGKKDAVAGTWSADLGVDGVVTWTFDGKGSCTMENPYMKQEGTYSLDGDQMTVQLELWEKEKLYTFSVDGDSLTMNDNEGMAVSGTYKKQ